MHDEHATPEPDENPEGYSRRSVLRTAGAAGAGLGIGALAGGGTAHAAEPGTAAEAAPGAAGKARPPRPPRRAEP